MNGPHSARDRFLRATPFEMAFPDPPANAEMVDAIAREAESRGVDPFDSGAFLMLAQVGRILRELAGGPASEALVPTFGPLLFQAFHFHRGGHPAFLVETPTLRYLLEADAAPEGWEGTAPAPAGYLQLPRHLLWARPGGEEGPAEALDGVFWVLGPEGALDLLGVTGMRGDRPGFSVLPAPPIPAAEAVAWLTRPARSTGDDFATTLPGGELDRLYSLETTGELVKLAARVLAHAETTAGALGPVEEAGAAGGAGEVPSRFPHRRIRLGS